MFGTDDHQVHGSEVGVVQVRWTTVADGGVAPRNTAMVQGKAQKGCECAQYRVDTAGVWFDSVRKCENFLIVLGRRSSAAEGVSVRLVLPSR